MRKAIIMIAILALGLYTGAAFAATDTVTVNATVGSGTYTVAITEAAIDFGTILPAEGDHRFSAGPMTVTYFAANSPWTIRVYTDNSPATLDAEKAGLVGADTTTFVPLKVWNANFGGGVTMPDPELDANWEGSSPVWLRVPEKLEHTSDPYTWRRLCQTGAELEAAGFENYLGIDVAGVKAQAYSTTLTVEIINQ